jgi:hypothetical protein
MSNIKSNKKCYYFGRDIIKIKKIKKNKVLIDILMKHNNVIPNIHLHKHWQGFVRTWFNQPARKQRRL